MIVVRWPVTRPDVNISTFGMFVALSILSVSPLACSAAASADCGVLAPYDGGPWDYRNQQEKLSTVERFHFTPNVELLIRGQSGTNIAQDLDFVLNHFPNHHRALASLARLAERQKTTQPPGAEYSVECRFIRALRFRPDDVIVQMLFASYLWQLGRQSEALRQLEQAKLAAPHDPFTQYNVGMLLLQFKHYDEALAQAHLAWQMGFTRTELRDRLKAEGKWVAPVPAPSDAASQPDPGASQPQ